MMEYVNPKYANRVLCEDSEASILEDKLEAARKDCQEARRTLKMNRTPAKEFEV